MSLSRHAFEERFACARGETVEALGRQGWYSYLAGGKWADIRASDQLLPEERAGILAGLIAAARFGETPPVNGGAGCP